MSVDVYVAVHVLLQAILPYFVPFLIMLMPLTSLINLYNKATLLQTGLILSIFDVYSYGRAISLRLCHPSVLACQHLQVAQLSYRPCYQAFTYSIIYPCALYHGQWTCDEDFFQNHAK